MRRFLLLVLLIGSTAATKLVAQTDTTVLQISVLGAGRVVSELDGIDCQTGCSYTFGRVTRIELLAEPEAGWAFIGWRGACSGSDACLLTIDSDTSVTAEFRQLVDGPPPVPTDRALLRNISYNGFVGGDGVNLGFIVERQTALSIAAERVPGAAGAVPLADPQLQVITLRGDEIARNDDCSLAEFPDLIGRPLATDLDACALVALDPGSYAVVADDANDGGGNLLFSVTAPTSLGPTPLRNISYNGNIGGNGAVLRLGFIVEQPMRLAITAERFRGNNGSSPVTNPSIRLVRLNGNGLASNDDCELANIADHIGRPLTTPQDACLVEQLDGGQYVIEAIDQGDGGNILFAVTLTDVPLVRGR